MKKIRKWSKPKLIILTRGKPEERVLENCKQSGDGSDMNGPTGYKNGCGYGGTYSDYCYAIGTS
ncbi:MAG: hypothetical protein NTW13_00415 [Candidatus Omnitrophica bacterium]|nr:hypothetical protein [Candidatus Omnitrophota bacterium]